MAENISPVVDAERTRLAIQAVSEVESIASIVAERAPGFEARDLFIHGLALRLADLAGVLQLVLTDASPGALKEASALLRC